MGVATQDMGVAADGSHKPDYQPGMELHAKYTLLRRGRARPPDQADEGAVRSRARLPAAGLRPRNQGIVGHCSRQARARPGDPHPGLAAVARATAGAAGSSTTRPAGQVALGFVTALDYANPWVSPFEEFQRWKQHPAIRAILEGGRRVAYGARAINEGGWQSRAQAGLPRRRADRLLGRASSTCRGSRARHTAMKSGMLAAEAIAAAIARGPRERRADRIR